MSKTRSSARRWPSSEPWRGAGGGSPATAAEAARPAPPGNCTFATWAAPTRFRRGLNMLRALVPLMVRRRPDAVIAHMCPIYLVLAAPFAKPLRVPLVIWYTHWTIDRTLRLATRLCDAALSVDRRSYPLA